MILLGGDILKYKISDLSKIFDVSTNTIRKYEKNGYILPNRNCSNGFRWYSDEDVSRMCLVRLYIKNGFTHNEIPALLDSGIEGLLTGNEERLAEMDAEIERLKSLRHRLKDNIVLLKRINEFRSSVIEMEAVPVYYVLHRYGANLLTEDERVEIIHKYMYDAPETQLIYLFKKEDLLNKTGNYGEGCSVKEKYVDRLSLPKNEYTAYYPKCKAVHVLVESHKDIFDDVLFYLEKNNLPVIDDILGVKLADIRENGESVKYVLLCVPI